jgi:hypothetical protein
MSSLLRALETLDRNSPSGLLESALDGVIFSTSDRYFSASVLLPDWMAEIKLFSALSNAFPVLDVELEVELEDAAEEVSSESIELAFCKLEINIECVPFLCS